MRDRQVFDQIQLRNGISVYTQPADVEYTIVHLQVPVGTAHNTGDILPGSFHFLEHIAMQRSQHFPDVDEYGRRAGLYGGNANASTQGFTTTFTLSMPNRHLQELLPGLFSAVFNPVISEQGILSERGIITSERSSDSFWYPGTSEIGEYLSTRWEFDYPYPLEQLFGSDEDLAAMSRERLLAAHSHYFDPRIVVAAVGNGDVSPLLDLLEGLELRQHSLPQAYRPMGWVRKEFHCAEFSDISQYELRIGGFINGAPDPRLSRLLNFIGEYLTNSTHGCLWQWLRNRLGWVYEIDYYSNVSRQAYDWMFYLPLQTFEQAQLVRGEFFDRARAALSDAASVNAEVDRLLGASAYWYATARDVIEDAMEALDAYGRIVSVAEWREHIEGCRDVSLLQQAFERYFSEDQAGSFCAVPKDK